MSRWKLFILVGLFLIAGCNSADSETTSRDPGIAFINWDVNDSRQLYAIIDGEMSQLTDHDSDIDSYAVAPDGNTIAYTLVNRDGSSEIWQVDPRNSAESRLLHACQSAKCVNPVWATDGSKLLYERTPLDLADVTRLWWLNLDGSIAPIFEDETIDGINAVFSPDGQWLAFYSKSAEAILLYNLLEGTSVILPTQIDSPVVWHPNSRELIFRDFLALGEQFGLRMLHYDVATAAVTQLSESLLVNDLPADWTQDGLLIFGRKQAQTSMGRQIMTMDVTHSAETTLTNDATIQHGVLSLAPDDTLILMQQFQVDDSSAQPSIWTLERASGTMNEISAVGIQPRWIP
jgi:Tol biopolymer transport system component